MRNKNFSFRKTHILHTAISFIYKKTVLCDDESLTLNKFCVKSILGQMHFNILDSKATQIIKTISFSSLFWNFSHEKALQFWNMLADSNILSA